jgi:hypothetical protein
MDVRQRDLFIQALTERLEEAKTREAWLYREHLAMQDELAKWRSKYEADLGESNDALKKLRRLLEEREDQILQMQALVSRNFDHDLVRLRELQRDKLDLSRRNADLEVGSAPQAQLASLRKPEAPAAKASQLAERVFNDDGQKIEELQSLAVQLERKLAKAQRQAADDKAALVKLMNRRFDSDLRPHLFLTWQLRLQLAQALKPRRAIPLTQPKT